MSMMEKTEIFETFQAPTPWQYFLGCLTTKYCCFSGRASRREMMSYYLFSSLLTSVIGLVALGFIAFALKLYDNPVITQFAVAFFYICITLFWLALLMPSLGVTVRRCHDTGRSGWWVLLAMIPFLNIIFGIVLFVFILLPGDPRPNNYGAPPRTVPVRMPTPTPLKPTPWQYIVRCLTVKYACVDGRANRREYWSFVLFYMLIILLIACGALLLYPDHFPILGVIKNELLNFGNHSATAQPEANKNIDFELILYGFMAVLVMAPFALPLITVQVRRLRDINFSWLWLLLPSLPWIGVLFSIVIIIFMLFPGTRGPNRFGPQPETLPQ